MLGQRQGIPAFNPLSSVVVDCFRARRAGAADLGGCKANLAETALITLVGDLGDGDD